MNRPRADLNTCGFSLISCLPAILFAAALALAPQPAFAQHGGGGGGGHAGGGGGHSGGGHASGGSQGKSSGAPPAGAAAHGAPSSSTPAKPGPGNSAFSPGSRVWGGSELGSDAKAAPNERFAASNNIWQDPPASRSSSPGGRVLQVGPNTFYATSGRSVENPAFAGPPNAAGRTANMPRSLFVPRTIGPFTEMRFEPRPFSASQFGRRFHRPIFFNGCFGGFFPGFCGGGFFFGPALFWGAGCDPFFWGWNGCGLNYGYGYGYSGDVGYDSNYDNGYNGASGAPGMNLQAQPMGIPPEENYIWQDAPSSGSSQAAPAPRVVTMLYFKDGSSYGVTDYWLAEGNLHYVTSYGGENSVRADLLDLQRTVDENAKNGVNFVLRPAAPATPQP